MLSHGVPDWFGSMLFSRNLPWDDMSKSSLTDFLSVYTLHDSSVITLHVALGHYAIAAINWDVGYERPILNPVLSNSDYAILLIYFPNFYQLHMGRDAVTFPFLIGEAKSITLTDEQRLALLNTEIQRQFHDDSTYEFLLESPICISTFISVENVRVEFTHGEAVYFVCLDKDMETHSIGGLTKR